jgi:hypothetical protein
MSEAEYKRAIFAAVDEETRAFLKDYAAVFGTLKNPKGWHVDGAPVAQEQGHGG